MAANIFNYDPRQDMMLSLGQALLQAGAPSPVKGGRLAQIPGILAQVQQRNQSSQLADLQRRAAEQQLSDANEAATERRGRAEARTQLGAMLQPTYTRETAVDDSGMEMPWAKKEPDLTAPDLLGVYNQAYPEEAGKRMGGILFPEPVKPDYENVPGMGILEMPTSAGGTPRVAMPAPPREEDTPEIVRLAQVANDPKRSQAERDAANAGIAAKTKADLNPIELKELFETADRHTSGGYAISALNDALEYNRLAYDGIEAEAQLLINRNLHRDKAGVEATTNFKNVILGQALEALRATFGGMPTEGERKVLLELQSSINLSRGEREAILKRALALAELRREAAAKRARDIQGGQFRASGTAIPASQPPTVLRYDAQGNRIP